MKKKILSVLLVLCMVSGTVVSPVSMENVRAEEDGTTKKTSEGFEYKIWNVYDEEDEEKIIGEVVEITNYTGTDTHVVIPEEIEGLKVTSLNVKDSYGEDKVWDNTDIVSLYIPSTVQEIEMGLLKGLGELQTVTVNENSPYFAVEDDILYNAEKTEVVHCPMYKTGIVNIPDGVIEVGWQAFLDCSKITEIKLPKSVKCIRANAFVNCVGLTSFYFPENLTELESSVFPGCTGIMEYIVDENNSVYASEDGLFYNKEKTQLQNVPKGLSGTVEIPEGVTEISYSAFGGCKNITNVVLPDSLTRIGYCAFMGCGITEIEIPNSVTFIDEFTFAQCKALEKVDLPNNFSRITGNMFSDCEKLEMLSVPKNVTRIGYWSFNNCSKLTSIRIPSSVNYIGEAFGGCTSLSDVYYEGNEEDWNSITIESASNEALFNATIHYNSTYEDFVGTDKIPENPQPEIPPVTTPDTESNEKVEDTKEPEITTIALDSVTVSKEKTTYTGKSQTPSITVTDANGQPVDVANYTVTYTNNKNVGQATVTVTGTNNYTGTLTANFTILPKGTSLSKVTAKKKAFTVKWKKQTKQTTGYQLAYSTSKNFKGAKNITVKKNKTTSTTVKKLKAKKKYYVRIRTYKTVKINGKSTKLYSGWSKAKTVKTKK